MGTILGREPVLALNVILALIALAAILWPQRLTPEVQAAVVVVAIAVVSFIARSQVTPAAAPQLPVGTKVTTPDGTTGTVVGG